MAGKNRNVFAIIISAVVVVAVVAVGALVVVMNNRASAPAQAPAAGLVNQDNGGVALGDGPDLVQEYVDFMCPACKRSFDAYGDDLTERIESGDITLEIHPISILDHQSQGTEYSTRAAAATYCVAEDNGDAFYPFVDLLFKNQPRQSSTGLDNDQLTRYAEQAGAAGAASCIADGTYMDFVAEKTSEANITATPTIRVNGEEIAPTMNFENDILPLLAG
ncbi:DsbA family protein [Microbacterium amylolyticum]|uniref:Protein-disulfide isomerase n=1 Tax=Microbacterium amylolyticum TaxID=936337 RepID=A0ABS4ZIM1_9MICO|nr:DsbA family protein [Microbacterium amylolyticum]MBP2437109.1 protein-disulfide isomerase [Microbacterium amylolyticum]